MIVIETICDRCGERKEKSNGWYKVEEGPYWFTITKHNGKSEAGKDCCSDNCVMILVSEFMQPKKTNDCAEEIMQDLESRIPQ